jgi:cbb3-type cytochrome oxidase subunit 1
MQIEISARPGLKIALCGAALMLIGVALASYHFESTANALTPTNDARQIVPLVPSVVGALLVFLGSIRASLAVRPLLLALLGIVLFIAATAIPPVVAQMFPRMISDHATLPSLLPLFVLRIIGLIFLSTALLRLLLGARNKA